MKVQWQVTAVLLTLVPLTALATAIVTDTFDSYSNGDLAGQGSWASSGTATAYDVQSTVVQGGTKAGSAPNSLNGIGSVYLPFASQTTGIITITAYVRNTNASTYGVSTWFMSGSTNL
jgi:hypothetical protein